MALCFETTSKEELKMEKGYKNTEKTQKYASNHTNSEKGAKKGFLNTLKIGVLALTIGVLSQLPGYAANHEVTAKHNTESKAGGIEWRRNSPNTMSLLGLGYVGSPITANGLVYKNFMDKQIGLGINGYLQNTESGDLAQERYNIGANGHVQKGKLRLNLRAKHSQGSTDRTLDAITAGAIGSPNLITDTKTTTLGGSTQYKGKKNRFTLGYSRTIADATLTPASLGIIPTTKVSVTSGVGTHKFDGNFLKNLTGGVIYIAQKSQNFSDDVQLLVVGVSKFGKRVTNIISANYAFEYENIAGDLTFIFAPEGISAEDVANATDDAVAVATSDSTGSDLEMDSEREAQRKTRRTPLTTTASIGGSNGLTSYSYRGKLGLVIANLAKAMPALNIEVYLNNYTTKGATPYESNETGLIVSPYFTKGWQLYARGFNRSRNGQSDLNGDFRVIKRF